MFSVRNFVIIVIRSQNYHFHINGVQITDPEKKAKLRELLANNLVPHNFRTIDILKECFKMMYFDPRVPSNHVIAKTDKSRNEVHFMYKDKAYREELELIREVLLLNFEQVLEHEMGLLPERLEHFTRNKDREYVIDESIQKEYRNELTKYLKQALLEVSKEFPDISKKIKSLSKNSTRSETRKMIRELVKETRERRATLREQSHKRHLEELANMSLPECLSDSDVE